MIVFHLRSTFWEKSQMPMMLFERDLPILRIDHSDFDAPSDAFSLIVLLFTNQSRHITYQMKAEYVRY